MGRERAIRDSGYGIRDAGIKRAENGKWKVESGLERCVVGPRGKCRVKGGGERETGRERRHPVDV